MKKILLLLSLTVIFRVPTASAQPPATNNFIRCGTAEYYKNLFSRHPEIKKQFEDNQNRLKHNFTLQTNRIAAIADTITLVVHVVAGDAIQQQVTDAIIQSQIDVLNEDYEGLNADSVRIPAAFKPLFGKSQIVFKLAGTNPFGEPTKGIVRVTTSNTYNQSDFDNVKFSSMGGSDAWNPAQYLNIWVVSFGETKVLGISVMPGDPRPLSYHGFVCDYRAFGKNAPYLFAQYNKGRTTTHELGHFFNLYHIWGDDGGACTGTDFPEDAANDDTPNQADATFGNPDPNGTGVVKTDNCSPVPPGIMYQNFMDYTDDVAMTLFTKGQQIKLQHTLTNAPDRSALFSSTAYNTAPAFVTDARIRSILSPVSPQCGATFIPTVILRNSGSAPLTTVNIVSVLQNSTPVVYKWSGSLSPYTETNVNLSSLSGKQGINTLSIYTSQPNGVADDNPSNDTTTVSFEVISITPLPTRFHEDFSASLFPPANWKVINPDNDRTWERNSVVGKNETGCVWLHDWNNTAFHRYDDLITPPLSYRNADSVFLYFNLAAATYSPPGLTDNDVDTLSIMITKDCGNSFTTVYKKWGSSLQTINTPNYPVSDEFFPFDDQWRKDSVNLGTILGEAEDQFQVYFRMSGNFLNNIFLDDINIITETVPEALKTKGYLILPTAFRSEFAIRHYRQPTSLQYVNIYSSTGQLVWRQVYKGNAQTFISVNLTGKPAGVYFVKLGYTDHRGTVTDRIVKYE